MPKHGAVLWIVWKRVLNSSVAARNYHYREFKNLAVKIGSKKCTCKMISVLTALQTVYSADKQQYPLRPQAHLFYLDMNLHGKIEANKMSLTARLNKYIVVTGLLWLVTSLVLLFLYEPGKSHAVHPQQIKAHHLPAYQAAARASFIY
jgi:hypothetical protein